MAAEMISLERDDVQSNKFEKYTPKADRTDRVGILFPDEAYANGKKIFCGTKAHFDKKANRLFVCKSTSTNPEICCTTPYSGNVPSYRLGAVVVVYNLETEGGKTKLKGWKVLPWIMSEATWGKLKKQDTKFPLNKFDVEVEGIQKKFLNLEITPCTSSIVRGNPEFLKKAMALYPAAMESAKNNLASDLNIEEIRELLGIEAPGSQDAASDVSIGDVLDGVA
jgi:hypothetical protein